MRQKRRTSLGAAAISMLAAGLPACAAFGARGDLLAERLLEDFVVYRVGDDKRQMLARAGVNNAEVTVTPRGVELRFVPGR